ncbi:YeeE/YedE family protein [Parvibium lacunae]|uniref:YeeE/YedE family protein n=1 Tax=Parvibium lacunae TaxID=1888893 RepID=A0A368L413_9BURK|nr:YeeE/YedE family protein [Parvibium lacunae]RCS58162.1 YeeE/YedE family protein [Parvibium lacunae]
MKIQNRTFSTTIFGGLSGFLFGIGLLIAGMTSPQKVLGFLDLFGHWDPSLALVMLGAIMTAAPTYHWLQKKSHTPTGEDLHLPTQRQIDHRLIGGSLLFGIGWGLLGLCPGPALVVLGNQFLEPTLWLFIVSMLLGMWIFEIYFTR